ncbi:Disease resistance protein [Melia azedarach]|uniref:Disease resistance protein n=1 Tax=Melia azedarach TaxID=155640 RepID=A0ACC1Y5U1_MELAZ|nr:Disease resistance protein [Melia azedarach]
MKNWMGEGLLGDVEGIDEKLGEAKEIMEELKDASLLERIAYENGEEIVKMHPIVWDMAVKLEKENPRLFSKPCCTIEKFSWEDLCENVERVSLMSNNLKELPSLSSAFKFHKLSTLLLQGNPLDIQLDRDFFNNFPNLQILDLSDTRVRLDSEALSCLKHLAVLLLRNCIHLTCLSSLSELLKLIVLDVSGCPIAELPSLLKLESLMVLNVSDCPIAELPSLSGLKELMVLDASGCPIAELPHEINHLTKLVRLILSRTRLMYNADATSWSVEEIGIWNCPQLQKFLISLWFDDEQNLVDPPNLKAIRGDDSWLGNLKRNSDPFVPFLERTLIKEPPPEELTSRYALLTLIYSTDFKVLLD